MFNKDKNRDLRQKELNDAMSQNGSLKFEKNALRNAKVGGFGETMGGRKAIDEVLSGLVEKLDEYFTSQVSQRGGKSEAFKKVAKLEEDGTLVYLAHPSIIARAVVTGVMSSLMRPSDKRISVSTVGTYIGEQLEYAIKTVVLDTEFEKEKHKKTQMLRRQGLLGDEELTREVMDKLATELIVDYEPWTSMEKLEVGLVLIQVFAKADVEVKLRGFGDERQLLKFGDLFFEKETSEFNFEFGHVMSRKTFKISKRGVEWLEDHEDFVKSLTFSYLPMVVPPMDWTIDGGGYNDPALRDRYTLMKGMSKKKLKELYEEFPQGFDKLMDTINIAQSVPFKINETVFRAVEWVDREKIDLGKKGVPAYKSAWVEILGSEEKAEEYFNVQKQLTFKDSRMTEESWDILDNFIRTVVPGGNNPDTDIKEVRASWFEMKDRAKKFKMSESSKRILTTNIINEAGQFLDEDIYFCYNADFRGRIYPISGLFSPQGSDTSKGMLEFAESTKVESFEAIDMIAFQIANSWGEDKVSIPDRIKWTHENTEMILECAMDFVENRAWMKADKPFLFLLGCIEWLKVKSAELSGDPLDFETTLPIAFDGSCNGIQHFSALLKDEEAAEHVNLTPQDVPADAYQVIANKAKELAEDLPNQNKKAKELVLRVNKQVSGKLFSRKVPKRATMTLPYGVSEKSAGDYTLEEVDAVIAKQDDISLTERKTIRKFVKKLVWTSIKENIGSPVVGKDYMQNIAKEMTTLGLDLMWFTPTGLPIIQRVMKKSTKFVDKRITVLGEVRRHKLPTFTHNLDERAQANGIAPNFVHSYDSAHLQNSVVEAWEEGMDRFLLIHDSFATDANSATRFNHIIREQFVDLYHGTDHFADFAEVCENRAKEEKDEDLKLDRLELGSFDVRQVLDSEYFFA